MYEGIRFIDVLRMARHETHILDLFGGVPAHLAFQALNLVAEYGQNRLLMWMVTTKAFRNPKTGRLRKWSWWSLECIDLGIQLLTWCAAYPLYEYSALQVLRLVPPKPFLPPASSLLPTLAQAFTTTPHTGLFPRWCPRILVRAFDSYLIWGFLESRFFAFVHAFCFNRFRRLLPRPDNPDKASINAALESDSELDIVQPEIEPRRTTRQRRRRRRLPQQQVPQTPVEAPDAEETYTPVDPPPGDGDAQPSVNTSTESIDENNPDTLIIEEIIEETIEEVDIDDLANLPINTHVQHPPRTSSLPNMDPETDERPTTPPAPRRRRRPHTNWNAPQHRLTTLSCHPCDTAASHIADAIATVTTMAAETVVLRSLATCWLNRNGMNAGQVYPVTALRSGWGPIAKAWVVELGVAWTLWQGTYWVSTWLGVGLFGYKKMERKKKKKRGWEIVG